MAGLLQNGISLQTLLAPVDTTPFALPQGCRSVSVTLNVGVLDLVSSKTLSVHFSTSVDGGVTWVQQGGFTWKGPSAGPLDLSSACDGFAGDTIKATIVPDVLGITTDAVMQAT